MMYQIPLEEVTAVDPIISIENLNVSYNEMYSVYKDLQHVQRAMKERDKKHCKCKKRHCKKGDCTRLDKKRKYLENLLKRQVEITIHALFLHDYITQKGCVYVKGSQILYLYEKQGDKGLFKDVPIDYGLIKKVSLVFMSFMFG